MWSAGGACRGQQAKGLLGLKGTRVFSMLVKQVERFPNKSTAEGGSKDEMGNPWPRWAGSGWNAIDRNPAVPFWLPLPEETWRQGSWFSTVGALQGPCDHGSSSLVQPQWVRPLASPALDSDSKTCSHQEQNQSMPNLMKEASAWCPGCIQF